ncbi:MAG: hypothetical protein IJE82_01250 [Alphaproteobacteria bacterium]|nr:hypothetical protein [Alphaproteobacteria bacterium]
MNKIYTSVLCMVLLVPTLARAEICTDFDDNMNIIEFDCSEGAAAARKRIAAEREKVRAATERQVEQERIAAEKVAATKREVEEQRKAAERAEREKQRELERATREKQRELERAEREKQRELERAERDARFLQKQQEITQGGCWKFVAGLGGAFWSGQELTSGVYIGETIRGYNGFSVQDASYSVGGFTLNAELATRYYLKNSPKWFWQIGFAYTSPLGHVIEIKQLSPSFNNNKVDDLEITTTMYSLQAMVGRMTWKNVYLYGKLGISYMDYAISGDVWFDSFGLKDHLSYTVGAGLEYSMWTWTSIYAGLDFVIPSGDTFRYADTLTSVNAGIRCQF